MNPQEREGRVSKATDLGNAIIQLLKSECEGDVSMALVALAGAAGGLLHALKKHGGHDVSAMFFNDVSEVIKAMEGDGPQRPLFIWPGPRSYSDE